MGFGKNNTGVIIRETATIALGTLAQNASIPFGSAIQNALEEDFRMLKSEVFCVVDGLTSGEGDGLCLTLVNGELSSAEIAECLLADGPKDRNDRVAVEKAERFVKVIGMINADGTAGMMLGNPGGGPHIIVKPQWTFSDPEGWAWTIFNLGSALQTGSTAKLTATSYGVWVT